MDVIGYGKVFDCGMNFEIVELLDFSGGWIV